MTLQAKQTIQQRLMLAPNVTLALEVLRMPMLELRVFLNHQLEENPCLELLDEEPHTDESSPSQPGAPESSSSEDWSASSRTAGEQEDADRDDSAEDRSLEQRLAILPSLHDSLLLQLGCQVLSQQERRLGELLIQRLDDNGYLDVALSTIADETGATLEELERTLRLIQQLDPPGVGARDLRECLLIQLEQRGVREMSQALSSAAVKQPLIRNGFSTNGQAESAGSCAQPPAMGRGDKRAGLPPLIDPCAVLAYRIVQEHFPLFVQHRSQAIAKATGASANQVSSALGYLRGLNPKPGCAVTGDLSPSVIPDLVVHHRERHYDVDLNDKELPHIMLSRTYSRMLRDPRTPADAKEFLANKFRRAGWLIKAIDERNATLLSIARCLISLQREFLENGPRAIKPLTQAQVADLIGRHPSTVSRAISGKTIDTPYGIFRLEQLFASSVPQGPNDQVSDERVKSEIQRLIAEEDPQHSLSDADLAERLAQCRISVARRTIAKYRNALHILPAHLRRRRL